MMLGHVDALTAQIDALTARIDEAIAPFALQVAQLDEIPGVGRTGAQEIIAEIGTEMARFPTAEHLVSWAKFAPKAGQSAGKNKPGTTGKGNPWIAVNRPGFRGGFSCWLQLPAGAGFERSSWLRARRAGCRRWRREGVCC
jgi:transposase IS116/IS110/IS902 family protein